MTPDLCGRIESVFWRHLYGEYETLERWAWVYVHLGIGLATALVGYAIAIGAYPLAALLLPFPLFYGYLRYRDARPEPIEGGE